MWEEEDDLAGREHSGIETVRPPEKDNWQNPV